MYNWTSLHDATRFNNKKMVEILLYKGADQNITTINSLNIKKLI